MKDGHRTERYPKEFRSNTTLEADGYPAYRRHSSDDGGCRIQIPVIVGGRRHKWVVPYNLALCRIFTAHLNVELCMSASSIMYVPKYVHKGNDEATFAIGTNDEIAQYQNSLYVGACETAWHILGFPIH